MSEMIERAAKAIRDTNANTVGLTFTELSQAMARAAIEAMRLPTDAMIEAAKKSEHGDDYHYPSPRHAWDAMIEEALRDGS